MKCTVDVFCFRGAVKDWYQKYERLSDMVVPRSTRLVYWGGSMLHKVSIGKGLVPYTTRLVYWGWCHTPQSWYWEEGGAINHYVGVLGEVPYSIRLVLGGGWCHRPQG